jgi:AcrR family transcriptional regulator
METLSRREQKEKTRSGLVQAAERLFARQGISRTTTAEVAKALRVSHGTVFVHFPTREDLILAVVEAFGDRLSEALGSCLSDGMALADLLEAHLSVLAEFEDFYLRLVTESQFLPPRIRGIQYAMNASLSYRFFRAAQPGMRDGSLKKLRQPDFFNTWMSLVHYHLMNRDLFCAKKPFLREKGRDIARLFFQLTQTERKER